MKRLADQLPPLAICFVLLLTLPFAQAECAETPAKPPAKPGAKEAKVKWTPLFDGKTLKGWKITRFGGEGEVTVKDGQLRFDFGYPLTGITSEREIPTMNYEVSLEAMRLDGVDFFCALTFPVAKSHCSLIVGGWAGAVVGLSSIDGKDASENETTQYMNLKSDKWYKIRVRVTEEKIEAWIDEKQVVDVKTKGRRIGTRVEVDLCKPLGISSFETRAALRNIRIRKLKPAAKKKAQPAKP